MTATVEHINKELDYEERMKRAREITNKLLSNHINYFELLEIAIDSVSNLETEKSNKLLTLFYLILGQMDEQVQPLNELLECFPEPSK